GGRYQKGVEGARKGGGGALGGAKVLSALPLWMPGLPLGGELNVLGSGGPILERNGSDFELLEIDAVVDSEDQRQFAIGAVAADVGGFFEPLERVAEGVSDPGHRVVAIDKTDGGVLGALGVNELRLR